MRCCKAMKHDFLQPLESCTLAWPRPPAAHLTHNHETCTRPRDLQRPAPLTRPPQVWQPQARPKPTANRSHGLQHPRGERTQGGRWGQGVGGSPSALCNPKEPAMLQSKGACYAAWNKSPCLAHPTLANPVTLGRAALSHRTLSTRLRTTEPRGYRGLGPAVSISRTPGAKRH